MYAHYPPVWVSSMVSTESPLYQIRPTPAVSIDNHTDDLNHDYQTTHIMATRDDIIQAIGNGNSTATAIAEAIDKDRSHIARELKAMSDEGTLTRTKQGRSYHYDFVDDRSEDGLSVHKGYAWSEWVPEDVPEYIPSKREYAEIRAEVDHRETADNPAHIRLTGPTGCGKTHLARALAQELEAPFFDISVKWATDTTDLLGRFVLIDGETQWINGPLTKAILASRERTAVLLLDEINRARPETKSALYEALDDRAQITIDALGGEVINGKAVNLVVISTMNVGQGHHVEELDLAEQRRLGNRWSIDFLGVNHPDREAQLIADRTPVSAMFAARLVEAANKVRRLANDPDEQLSRGIPTGLLLELAASAYKYAQAGLEDAALRATRTAVVDPYYQRGDREITGRDTVVSTFRSFFEGMPSEAVVENAELQAWADEDIADTDVDPEEAVG